MIKFFGSKKEPEKPLSLGKGFLPVDKIKDLSSKGFSETEIIDILRKEGFNSEEIDRALTQSLKIGVTGEETKNLPTLQDFDLTEEYQTSSPQNMPIFQQPTMFQQPTVTDIHQPVAQPLQYPQQQEYYQQQEFATEELIESIVHERMIELDERLAEFKTKYSDLERKILDLHNRLSILAKGGREKDSEIISKIDSYKDILEEVSAKLSSLEKTFKEALPALIESVRSLTDLVHEMKRKS